MPEMLARPFGLRVDAASNRARLLAAAAERLRAGRGLPLNDLAREAGVGVGTAYRHFPSRRHLVEALGFEALEALLVDVGEAARIDDAASAMRRIVEVAFAGLRASPALIELLEGPGFSCSDAEALAGELLAALRPLLERAHREGSLRADVGVDELRRLLCGVARASVSDDDGLLYLDVLLRGLA